MKKINVVILGIVALSASGCAMKMQMNPVTWTDDRYGYELKDVRAAVKGPQPGQYAAESPRVMEQPEEPEVRGSAYRPSRTPNWRRY